jgi:hypothetical protein
MGALWRGEVEVVPPTSTSHLQHRPLADHRGSPKNGTQTALEGDDTRATRIARALKRNGVPGRSLCARPRRWSWNAREGTPRTVSKGL